MIILVALGTTLLLGVGALAIDAAYMYDLRNRLAATADAAALSAAREVKRGNANYAVFATREVKSAEAAGLIPTGVTIDAHLCGGSVCTSPYNTTSFVEVILEKNQSTFLGRILGLASMTPKVRAVAGTSASKNCFVVLETMDVKNNLEMNMPGCAAQVKALDVDKWGGTGGKPIIDSFATVTCAGSCPSPPITTGNPVPEDPFKDLVEPDLAHSQSCAQGTGQYSPANNSTIAAGRYCGGINFGKNVVHLANGIFHIDGDITGSNGGNPGLTIDNPAGGGVLIYMHNGKVDLAGINGVTMTLSGMNPTTADAAGRSDLAGIVFFTGRTNTNKVDIGQNNFTLTFTGAFYVPNATLEYKNNGNVAMSNGNDCSIIVAKNFNFKNNGKINNACKEYGGSPLNTVAVSE